MAQNERMLELAGLSRVLSSARFAICWHRHSHDKPIQASVRVGLQGAIDFLTQALRGSENKQVWDKEAKFALSREYMRQDDAYRTVCLVLDKSDDEFAEALREYIQTLEAVRDGHELQAPREESANAFLKRADERLKMSSIAEEKLALCR